MIPIAARRFPGLSHFPLLVTLAMGPSAHGDLAAPPAGTDAAIPCPASIPELYDAVSPAVVSVTATAIDPGEATERVTRVAGSGVIIDPSGLIVTNSHVVFGRRAILVTLDDGTSATARLVGADPIFDVALLKISSDRNKPLPSAVLGDSGRLRVGEEVFAIGNPFGLEQTLTRGIVSAVNRIVPGSTWSVREPMIQTDAAINHGSSGGPLVDRCGRVVGINTALLPDAQGIGFSIPIDLVRSLLPDLRDKGRVVRPWLGVQGQVLLQPFRTLFRTPSAEGFLVEVVESGSPAAAAGIQGGDLDIEVSGSSFLLGGDIITDMNGRNMGDPASAEGGIASLKIGEKCRVTVVRGDETFRLEIPVVERPILPQDVSSSRTAANRGPSAARRVNLWRF
jgi:serine protease Do